MAEPKFRGPLSHPAFLGASLVLAIAAVIAVLAIAGGRAGKRQSAEPSTRQPQASSTAAPLCGGAPPGLLAARRTRPDPYPMTLEPRESYEAQITTSCGTMFVKLMANQAPIAVNNFIHLAQDGFYQGQVFHRIDTELGVIQAGDPGCPGSVEQCGFGGPGYTIRDEFDNGLKARVGTVAMASAGTPDSSGSQFLIIAKDVPVQLPKQRTIFGQLADPHSFQVARLILSMPTKVAPNAPEGAPANFPAYEYVYIDDVKILRGSSHA